jgi:capsule polysaccharide export protein KpsE/RkpR
MRNVPQEITVSPGWPAAIGQFRARWRVIAIACAVAAGLSLTASVLMPRRYTAFCRILVDAPAGSDPRVSTAVSPIYLESLRTYEMFAASDDLFQQAARKFGLRTDSSPIEKLKKKILKVEVLRNTKILEISATLADPVKAHELALYVGQEAVSLNRTVGRTADQELLQGAEAQSTVARQAFDRAQQAWSDTAVKGPVDQVSAELQADIELRSRLQRLLAAAEVDLAEAESEQDVQPAQVKAAKARVDQMRGQVKALDQNIAREQSLTAERTARMQKLETERRSAEAALKTAETRVNDIRSSAGYRGERLNIIDPGIIPERPSSPNVPLNVLAAVFAAFVLSVLYVLLQVSYSYDSADD